MEQQQLTEELKGLDPSMVQLKGIVDGGVTFEQPLTYFNGENNEERVEDLFMTMDLNPPQSMTITFNGKSVEL